VAQSVCASIIVCTYNRADVVCDTLAGLQHLELPKEGIVEVIVVDNASTDHTREVCETGCQQLSLPARYIYEGTPGVSAARNRAIAEARGEVLAFLDDDAVSEPGWLNGILAVYDQYPNADCVGGRIVLDWKTPPPPWWNANMDHHLSALDLGPDVIQLHYPDYPYGANMSFRRRVFARGGAFDSALGRRGKVLEGGAETAMCMAVEQAGGELYYTPHATVHHRADDSRAQADYLLKKSYRHGRSRARMEAVFVDFDTRVRKGVGCAIQALTIALLGKRSVETACEWRYRVGYVWESLCRTFR